MQMADWQIGRLGHFDVSVIYLPQKLRIPASCITDNCLVYYGYLILSPSPTLNLVVYTIPLSLHFNIKMPALAQLEKMLYLCTRNQEVAGTSEGCGSA